MTAIINRSCAWIYCPLIRSHSPGVCVLKESARPFRSAISIRLYTFCAHVSLCMFRTHRHMTLFSAWLIGCSIKYRLQFSSTFVPVFLSLSLFLMSACKRRKLHPHLSHDEKKNTEPRKRLYSIFCRPWYATNFSIHSDRKKEYNI